VNEAFVEAVPLAGTTATEGFAELYERRRPVYQATADALVDAEQLDGGEPLVVPIARQAALAELPRPVALVIDNSDHLTDRSITGGLDALLRNAGGRLRLVLAARADPLLPLHQYRLNGTMAEIRVDQLNFTPEETRELLTAMGVPVTLEVAQGLCAETQGWAVGLRLAAAPLKQGVPPQRLVTSLAHDDGSVAQYLFAEVLDGQPASVRRVLLRTSVTAELWPDLVDRLGGRPNVRRVLAGLAHANAFVEESPGAPGGFRIHPLFREMLQAELSYHHAGEIAELHRICARWYAEAGRAPEALAAVGAHRVLCAHRQGPRGVAHWSALARRWVIEDLGVEPRRDGLYAGLALLVTANQPDVGLWNGDIGVVVADGDDLVAAFAFPAGPVRLPLGRLGDVTPLYASTVHRAQGSQAAEVVLVVPEADSPLGTRETLYTGVTRAVDRVRIVGSEEGVRAAVRRQVARATGLAHRLGNPG